MNLVNYYTDLRKDYLTDGKVLQAKKLTDVINNLDRNSGMVSELPKARRRKSISFSIFRKK